MIPPLASVALGSIAGMFCVGVGYRNGYRRGYERGYEGALAVEIAHRVNARRQAREEASQGIAQRDEAAIAASPMRTEGFLTFPAGIAAHHGDELVFQIPGFDP